MSMKRALLQKMLAHKALWLYVYMSPFKRTHISKKERSYSDEQVLCINEQRFGTSLFQSS